MPSVVKWEECLIRSPLQGLKSKIRSLQEKAMQGNDAVNDNIKGHDSTCKWSATF